MGWMTVGHALENVFEIGVGLDVVELGDGDWSGNDGPAICASIGAGEEMILAAKCHFQFILPMSGKTQSSTINGICVWTHCSMFSSCAARMVWRGLPLAPTFEI